MFPRDENARAARAQHQAFRADKFRIHPRDRKRRAFGYDLDGAERVCHPRVRGDVRPRDARVLQDDGQRQLAADGELSYSGSPQAPEDYRRTSETVLVDGAQGDEPVVTQRTSPTYRGALVVCQGGGQASVRLAVTEAVTVLTGLPADRVTVAKCQ